MSVNRQGFPGDGASTEDKAQRWNAYKCVHMRRPLNIHMHVYDVRASWVALVVKNPPANAEMPETQFQSLGWEESLEMCACVLSHFSCVQLFATPWTVAHQAPLSMGFSRQEY